MDENKSTSKRGNSLNEDERKIANMDESDLEEFDKFVERNWGKARKNETIPVSVGVALQGDPQEEQPKRRGRPRKS